ncbi:DUF4275 family protein [Bacillus sp. ISL-40]|uniref:DUF4275 family protein n=1 Tax=unclassified Bacillus (in: firmicutes) TaxID=185979 RepID=UPI001BE5C219|nr:MULTISPECIES: DUF4275 family protein [unclassified Bacillus (in: firmicutes)]MBT2696634.1 DUF4275 family protein [Bacillus sp. ISL-40]MBT2739989.1 DUF4275 family protein [Bacillus sp. ISL-77]
MEQIDVLKDSKIGVFDLNNKGQELQKQWGEVFARELSKNQKRQIHYGQFMWHVFSYELLPCKKGQRARDAFDLVSKDECYIFYQNNQNALLIEKAASLKSNHIINEIDGYIHDVYVVDKDFSWTYILTHEENCGPYFYRLAEEPFFFN